MRKWFAIGLVALLLGACGTVTSYKFALDAFPLEKKNSYVIWRYADTDIIMNDTFCRIEGGKFFEDCTRKKTSDPSKLYFRGFGVSFEYEGEYYIMRPAAEPRRGRYALFESYGRFANRTRTLTIGDATFAGSFAPGTITVIPHGGYGTSFQKSWQNKLKKALEQAFGERVKGFKIVTAKQRKSECHRKNNRVKCELKK
ncbi:hypothetical protein PsW64_04104 [Pseudovibrio sp. W64]|uniref:hypothetical protein n=1 Tax=unclassified Pseudovibrio TaxID=2627060 RepID=UPI0007AEDF90|nr:MULTISPECIES: hypothetical protein [unclassified Pseudovibrio]KZK78465.1 hypothetical protein PsW64_04104 [Pseudovibrio sp. W64]KZK84285.1 hypothetical protein PsAD13_02324 [Pseudovibrio sp. Ad13]